MSRRSDARAGFTLLEVLLAVAMILMLFGAMYGFLFNLMTLRTRTLERSGHQQAARTLIEHVERDLQCCLVGGAGMGAGVHGDGTSLRILTRAVPAFLAERGADDPTVFTDLQQIEYVYDPEDGVLEARRVAPGVVPPPAFEPIGSPLGRVRFRFFDGTAWRSSFDSRAAGRLPAAVEVAVWFNPWPETARLLGAPDDGDSALAREATPDLPFDATFDEAAFAELSDRDGAEEPRPDRHRVISVPDSAGDEEGRDERGVAP